MTTDSPHRHEPVGTPTEDGLREPLQYRLGERTLLALIPSDGLDCVLGDPLSTGGTPVTVSLTTVELLPEDGGTRLILTEYGVFLQEKEIPKWREKGTHSWLDSVTYYLAAPTGGPSAVNDLR